MAKSRSLTSATNAGSGTPGGTRRYSSDDPDRARRIGNLLTAGLNLAGIAMVLDLEEQNTHLRTITQKPTDDP